MDHSDALDRSSPTAADLFTLLQKKPPRSTTFLNITLDGVLNLRLNHEALGAVQVDFGSGCWEVWIVGRVVTGAIRHALPPRATLTAEAVHADIQRVLVRAARLMPEDVDAQRFADMVEHPPTPPTTLGPSTAMITANPATILRAFKLINGEQAIEVPRQVRHSDSGMTWPYKPDEAVPQRFFVSVADAGRLRPVALAACLRSTRGGAFVLMVARVADELAQAEVQSGATALEIARRVIAHQLAAGEADVQPGAASAVALLALQVNGQANLAALADLGELRDPPLTLGEP